MINRHTELKRYKKALKWMSEACQEYGVMLSLVMPNQYNHAENELEYGDMMRVNEDVANGGWDNSTRGPEKGGQTTISAEDAGDSGSLTGQ